MTKTILKLALWLLVWQNILPCHGQDLPPFSAEVEQLNRKYEGLWDPAKETVVFTGSSSIRMWQGVDTLSKHLQIINTGFGGSQASDLAHFLDDLVLRYRPKKVFIYEGDNDLWAKKRPNRVIADTKDIIARIQEMLPSTHIYLIGAKPSISRWRLMRRYKRFNRKLQRLEKQLERITYIDVWYPMLQGRSLRKDLFIKDGLHMNAKGYAIWQQIIQPILTSN